MRVWREASLSCRCHGTCLSIDFHSVEVVKKVMVAVIGELMVRGVLIALKNGDTGFFSCVSDVEDLQRRPWKGWGVNIGGQQFWGCFSSTEPRSPG